MSVLDRRQALILGGAAALAAGAPAWAAQRTARPILIADAALDGTVARRAARAAGADPAVLNAGEDPVRFWARIAPLLPAGAPVLGLTGWADYLVLRGMAAEGRRRVWLEAAPGEALRPRAPEGGALSGPLEAALAATGAARGARLVWALA